MNEEQMKKLLKIISSGDDKKKQEELTEIVESVFDENQKKKLGEVMANRELAEKLLATDKARKLLEKFSKGDDN